MKSIGIIPARWASTRFPGKPLAEIGGVPMVQRVYERCKMSRLDEVVVATDDERIAKAVEGFGGMTVMTAHQLSSGTDRCREALKKLESPAELVVNVQGDEPFVDPGQINMVLNLLNDPKVEIATLISPALSAEEVMNPNRVKAVVDAEGNALYFSRQPIPYYKGAPPEDWPEMHRYFIHLGIYGFSRGALMLTEQLPPGSLERAESLEQLRWLESGMKIATFVSSHRSEAVDTPEDLLQIEKRHFL